MKIGVCGPIDTRPLMPYLDAGAEAMPAGMGGASVVALVRGALESGWRVTVFSLDSSLGEELIATGPRLKICMGPYRPRHRARDLFAAERRYLAAAIARERPDAVHAHWTYEFALGALESGLPAVITAHDRPLQILRWDHSPYRLVRTLMARIVTRRARCLTAVSEPVAAHYRRYFGWRGPLPVIPNCLEPEWFEAPDAAVPREGLTFAGVLTGWGPLKNGATLLEAFAAVRRDLPGTRLLLFGYGHGPGEEAERWALRRNLCAGVEFIGQIERRELRKQLRVADVLVHPSREESYSMAVAEAMAAGLPVIALPGSGGIADTLDGGRDALLAADHSPAALAVAMLRLARDPALRVEMAQRAQAAVRRDFSAARVLAAYAELYGAVGEARCECCTY